MTLVEVATVVVIVSLLAVIAIVGYRRHIAAARMNEVNGMLAAIRAAQSEYKAEKGLYAGVSQDLRSYYPDANPGTKMTQWGGPCTNCANGDAHGWQRLKVLPSGPLRFGYATTAAVAGDVTGMAAMAPSGNFGAPPIDQAIASTNTIQAGDPYFIAMASADTDGNGVSCLALTTSHSASIVVGNEGE
jgi:type II secretory pathway pseudopilin PulG